MRKPKQAPPVVISAPPHFSPRASLLWRSVVPSRCRSPGRLALLEEALAALDRADMARGEIAAAGLTTTTKTTGAVHVHPLVKVERESRSLFAKIWGQLGLSWDQSIDGRDSLNAFFEQQAELQANGLGVLDHDE